jgi:hypothetical protein
VDLEQKLDLGPLKRGEDAAWTTQPGQSGRFVYHLRQALHIASLYPDVFPELAQYATRYRFTQPSDSRVEAKLQDDLFAQATIATGVPHSGDAVHGRPSPMVGLQSAQEVIDSWNQRQPSNDKLACTNTRLSHDEMLKLWKWANAHTPRLMLVVSPDSNILTVSLYEIDVAPFVAWQPPATPED